MKELRKRFDRFCLKNRNKGIPNLMMVIGIGNVVNSHAAAIRLDICVKQHLQQDVAQLLADHIHRHICIVKRLNGFKTAVYLAFYRQRLFNKAAQRARPHRCTGVIQNTQKRTLLLSGSHGLR